MADVGGTPYEIDDQLVGRLREIETRVSKMREGGKLGPAVLTHLRKFFKIKNIYNSNAIEGNVLNVGETRLVVEEGLTLTGRPLKDQAEAKNLSEAIDFLEELAGDSKRPIVEADVRQLHYLVLKNIREADAGKYRTVSVEIGGSHYKPPPPESVPAQMQEFCRWLSAVTLPNEKQDDVLIIAAAAHTWFVTIHPFIDGNGRVGRLILNLILMRHGYPIAIITNADKSRYYDALEISQSSDLTAITSLVSECLEESLEEYESAAQEQQKHNEWAQSIVGKLERSEQIKASNQYEVWKSAMELLKSFFSQTAEIVDSTAMLADVWFKDFGQLELEKYIALKANVSAKRTWFFRIDFRSGNTTARYLFFFGTPSYAMRQQRVDVALHIAREEPPGSFNYERLDSIVSPNVPQFFEIGYDASREEFLLRRKVGGITPTKIESLCRDFFDEVVKKHFSKQ